MATVSVRYIVNDVDAAITFYCQHLGFHEDMHPAPTFAMLSRGDLRLVLSAPSGVGGGGQAMPDGTRPEPGGWNRFSIEVADLPGKIEELRAAGVHFRNDMVTGVGGKPDSPRRSIRQPRRAVRADPARGFAHAARLATDNRIGLVLPPAELPSLNGTCQVDVAFSRGVPDTPFLSAVMRVSRTSERPNHLADQVCEQRF